MEISSTLSPDVCQKHSSNALRVFSFLTQFTWLVLGQMVFYMTNAYSISMLKQKPRNLEWTSPQHTAQKPLSSTRAKKG